MTATPGVMMTLAQAFAQLQPRIPSARLVGDGATPLARVHTDTRTLQAGGDVRALSLIHATRVAVIVTIVPFVATSLYDVTLSGSIGAPMIDRHQSVPGVAVAITTPFQTISTPCVLAAKPGRVRRSKLRL